MVCILYGTSSNRNGLRIVGSISGIGFRLHVKLRVELISWAFIVGFPLMKLKTRMKSDCFGEGGNNE